MATGYITSRGQCTLLPPSLPIAAPPWRPGPPPGEGPDPECSPGRATRALPTGQRRCQLASRLDNRPRAPMAHRQLASPRPPSPTLPPSLLSPLSSPPSRPAAGALARNPPSSPANWPPFAPSRSDSPLPRFPRTPSPSPGRRPRSRPTVREAPRTALRGQRPPRPRPLPHPRRRPLALSPTPCEPASRTKRPRAMVAGQRRRAASTSAARLGHTPTHRPARRLSHRLSGPHRPSVVRANAPVSELDSQGDVFAPNVGPPPLRSTHLTVPTGQCRRQLVAAAANGRARCQLVNSAAQVSHVLGRGAAGLSPRPSPPRRCQLAAGLGRAEHRRGSTPSVVSASSRSPPTARARTGTSVDGEVCLHKSSQGSG